MKIPRSYVGKVVEIVWRDPHGGDRMLTDKLPTGYQGLSTWWEYGIIDDITDGVIRLIHSRSENPPYERERDEEKVPSFVHEALIERLTIHEPVLPVLPVAPSGGATKDATKGATEPLFQKFQKIPRLSRDCIITEKIDGTNGVIYVSDDGLSILAGSRSRWLSPGKTDNFGFAAWVQENQDELRKLGPGYHYGEWWGKGIQRGYGLDHKRFSLFNVLRWGDPTVRPKCCYAVPNLGCVLFDTALFEFALNNLRDHGSYAARGFMRPEGIVVFHVASGHLFKKTLENDAKGKEWLPTWR